MENKYLDMRKKVCMVTGGTSGIGRATAVALARRGATVIVVGRDLKRCRRTIKWIQKSTGNTAVDYLLADLSSQNDIRDLVKIFKDKYNRLHILVNNAGARFMKYQQSGDGWEMTFALNNLGPFLLTHLLLDVLRDSAPARIINVTSGNRTKDIDFENLTRWQVYDGRKAYAQSKLANILFTVELARQLTGSGITVNAVEPGGVATRFNKNNGWIYWLRHLLGQLKSGNLISAAEAANTIDYLLCSVEVEQVSGKLFFDKKIVELPAASQSKSCQKLWVVSCKLSGLRS